MKMIVGLGNPEKKYEHTRHNLGFRVAESFIKKHSDVFQIDEHEIHFVAILNNINARYKATLFEGILPGGEKVLVVFPLSFMNNSGIPVQNIAHYFKVAPEDILVVHDDKDMDFGTMKLVAPDKESSSGGHNGVNSIIEHLGSARFHRLKVGVANDQLSATPIDTSDFVLQRFTDEEEKSLADVINTAQTSIQEFLGNSIL